MKSSRALRVALACFGVMVAASVGAAQATVGKILYTIQGEDHSNVVYVQDDTRSDTRAIIEGRYVWGSSWLPDGQFLLFNRQDAGLGQIYQSNADGTDAKKLTDGGGHAYNPAWSPAGKLIAYAEDRAGQPRLMLMSADTLASRVLYDGAGFFNTWSPDGAYAVVTVDGKPIVLDVATGQAVRLRIQGFEDQSVVVTDWNGDQIAFTLFPAGSRHAYTVSIDGTNARLAVPDMPDSHALKWSADGARFVFISSRDSQHGDVFIANSDGSNIQRVTFFGDTAPVVTLDYWTPGEVRAPRSLSSLALRWTPLAELVDTRIMADPNDPVSVAQKAMSFLLSGTLSDEIGLICPELQETYRTLSQDVLASFANPDLSGVTFTLVSRTDAVASVQLSGSMSLLSMNLRAVFPASLLPVYIDPVTLLYLTYDGGWQLCTPV